MNEEVLAQRLHQLRQALLAVYGVVLTLLVIVLFGDLADFYAELPAGWSVMWFLTTFASIPMGVFLLVGKTWRRIALTERRGPAMAYLMAGFFNLFSLAIYSSIMAYEPVMFCVPGGFGLIVLLVYARVYHYEDRVRDENFP